jgi:hypothetical protein
MPKSKLNSGKSEKNQPAQNNGSGNAVAIAAIVLIVAGIGYYFWNSGSVKSTFLKEAASGETITSKIKTTASKGTTHLRPGESYNYQDAYPTSGSHDPIPTQTGFYAARQKPTKLVHALEHGNIVIYYDKPGDEVLETLRSWAVLYSGPWDGVVVTPSAGIGQIIVMTAWTKRMSLEKFNRAEAAAFIDIFRGRGPEKPVR